MLQIEDGVVNSPWTPDNGLCTTAVRILQFKLLKLRIKISKRTLSVCHQPHIHRKLDEPYNSQTPGDPYSMAVQFRDAFQHKQLSDMNANQGTRSFITDKIAAPSVNSVSVFQLDMMGNYFYLCRWELVEVKRRH